MSSFKKFYLVQEDEYSRLKDAAALKTHSVACNPQTKAAQEAELDKMQSLKRTDMGLEDRLKMYEIAQEKVRGLTEEPKQLRRLGEEPKQVSAVDAVEPVVGEEAQHPLAFVPARLRQKAQKVVDQLRTSSDTVSWNDRGELVLDKTNIVAHTNIDDIFRFLYVNTSSVHVPQGIDDFLRAYASLNIPSSLLSSTVAVKRLEKVVAGGLVGRGVRRRRPGPRASGPPGKKSRILYLYKM